MKRFFVLVICQFLATHALMAQCSICTKTAAQLGEEPASGMNTAIIYLMATPLILMGFIGYRWWRKEKQIEV
jgi:hypothetical protein